MNKTIFIRGADIAVWDEAKGIADSTGTTMSQVLTDLLRFWILAVFRCSCGKPMTIDWQHCPHCGSPRPAAGKEKEKTA